MTKPVISVEHLTKRYDLGVIGTGTLSRDLNRWWARIRKQPDPYTRIGKRDAFEQIGESILALDDVSFTVEQGEVLGIIGRNGAGKSTLLKILSRVTAPTSGVMKVKGRIGSLLEVGTGFHPELTGRENIYLNGAILGMKKAEVASKFDEIVDFAGVEKFIDTPVKRYSSGMYVRLAFAVAAHLESEILLVDEVLAVGDAEFQKKCLGKMGDVATNQGRTVLFVSHNLAALESICSLGLILEHGKNTHIAPVIDVLSSYRDQLGSSLVSKSINRDESGKNIKLLDYSIQNQNNSNSNVYQTGDSLQFAFSVLATNPINDAYVGISIFDYLNRLVFALNSMEAGISIGKNSSVEGEIHINFYIPKLLLLSGKYFVSFYIVNRNGEKILHEPIVTEFIVEPKDFTGSGHAYSGKHGVMIIPYELSIENIKQNEKVCILSK
jgi:lipopolysaccharide transport system ATP-binding protein